MLEVLPEPVISRKHRTPWSFFRRKSKTHLTSSISSDEEKDSEAIFGARLEDGLSLTGVVTPDGYTVPYVVCRCGEEIRHRALDTIGLFRLSGGKRDISDLQLYFHAAPYYGKDLNMAFIEPHSLTGVLKKYLKFLPDPVIPCAFHDEILNGIDLKQSDEQIVTQVALVLKKVPVSHLHLLCYIIKLGGEVLRHSSKNLMTAEALSVVLAPTCTGFDKSLSEQVDRTEVASKKRRLGGARSTLGRPSVLLRSSSDIIRLNAQWTRIFHVMLSHWQLLLEQLLVIESFVPANIGMTHSNIILQEEVDTLKPSPLKHSQSTNFAPPILTFRPNPVASAPSKAQINPRGSKSTAVPRADGYQGKTLREANPHLLYPKPSPLPSTSTPFPKLPTVFRQKISTKVEHQGHQAKIQFLVDHEPTLTDRSSAKPSPLYSLSTPLRSAFKKSPRPRPSASNGIALNSSDTSIDDIEESSEEPIDKREVRKMSKLLARFQYIGETMADTDFDNFLDMSWTTPPNSEAQDPSLPSIALTPTSHSSSEDMDMDQDGFDAFDDSMPSAHNAELFKYYLGDEYETSVTIGGNYDDTNLFLSTDGMDTVSIPPPEVAGIDTKGSALSVKKETTEPLLSKVKSEPIEEKQGLGNIPRKIDISTSLGTMQSNPIQYLPTTEELLKLVEAAKRQLEKGEAANNAALRKASKTITKTKPNAISTTSGVNPLATVTPMNLSSLPLTTSLTELERKPSEPTRDSKANTSSDRVTRSTKDLSHDADLSGDELLESEGIDFKKLSPKERRQIRNKISARNFRVRRKEYMVNLESQMSDVQKENKQLRGQVDELSLENSDLKRQLDGLRKEKEATDRELLALQRSIASLQVSNFPSNSNQRGSSTSTPTAPSSPQIIPKPNLNKDLSIQGSKATDTYRQDLRVLVSNAVMPQWNFDHILHNALTSYADKGVQSQRDWYTGDADEVATTRAAIVVQLLLAGISQCYIPDVSKFSEFDFDIKSQSLSDATPYESYLAPIRPDDLSFSDKPQVDFHLRHSNGSEGTFAKPAFCDSAEWLYDTLIRAALCDNISETDRKLTDSLPLSALLVLATLAVVNATTISITNPVASTVWKAGGSGEITWTSTSAGSASFTSVTIDLLTGNFQNANIAGHIATTPVPVSAGSFVIQPINDFASGNNYWIRIGDAASNTWFYSAAFTLDGTGSAVPLSLGWSATATGTAANLPSAAGASGATATIPATAPTLSAMATGASKAAASGSASASASSSASASASVHVKAGLAGIVTVAAGLVGLLAF
ncbi:hypothetical protein BZG36_03733 [Bifiguratus adelaidae]|uniref:BZIP domain-containing protein n=1 Tax=Bifiguratus adelaidae TaxID=1938954 RepID=A0A261XZ37_9FUNG|nr:hypothetical protein BZG36_03733 [Bifiguratus adelaidae]